MTLRVAQVGCGYWGKNLARNFAELGALHAVVDDNRETAEKMAREHGALAATFDAVLADDAISAVSLATPAPMHAQMALAAVKAGKHVFVEKPLALDISEAKQLVAAAHDSGCVLMVGHLLQYHPIFAALQNLVEKGALGKLQYIYSNRLSFGKIRIEENVLWSFAPHDVSMILALTGEVPCSVLAEGSSVVTAGIADNVICHMRFPSGVRAHINASWLHPFKEHRLVVTGDKATAVFEDSHPDWSKRLSVHRHVVSRPSGLPIADKGEVEYIEVEPAEPLRAECSHFLDAVRFGTAPRTDAAEGLRVLEVLTQAEESLARSIIPAGTGQ